MWKRNLAPKVVKPERVESSLSPAVRMYLERSWSRDIMVGVAGLEAAKRQDDDSLIRDYFFFRVKNAPKISLESRFLDGPGQPPLVGGNPISIQQIFLELSTFPSFIERMEQSSRGRKPKKLELV